MPAGGTWHEAARPVSDPFRARTTRDTEGVLIAPDTEPSTNGHLVVPYDRTSSALRAAIDPLPTQTTIQGDALVGAARKVEDCSFRMLDVGEIQGAMAFTADYRVLGTKRQRVRQLGNAVTPPAARDLLSALTEVIT